MGRAGWLLPQLVLMGPALVGTAVPMPLGLLAINGVYLPDSPGRIVPETDRVTSDIIDVYGPVRESTAKELRAGRLPLWQPANFSGGRTFRLLAKILAIRTAISDLAIAALSGMDAFVGSGVVRIGGGCSCGDDCG